MPPSFPNADSPPASSAPEMPAVPIGTGRPDRITMFAFALVLELFILAFSAIQTVGETRPRLAGGLGLGAVAALAIFAALRWRSFQDLFSSIRCLLVLMIFLTLGVVVGTLILQNERPESYAFSYGPLGWKVIDFFHLDNLYQSLWFRGLIAFLFLNVLVVTIRRHPIRRGLWGFLAVHVSVMIILAGGMGALWAEKGWIDLKEGQSVTTFQVTRGNTMQFTNRERPLGFELRLADFQLEEYDKEFKLYAYLRKPAVPQSQEGHYDNKDFYQPFPFKVTGTGLHTIPGTEYSVSIDEVYPDYVFDSRVLDDPREEFNPAIEVVYGDGPDAQPQWMDRFNPELPVWTDSRTLVFSWEPPEPGFEKEVVHPEDHPGPATGTITLTYKSDGGKERFAAEEGKSYDVMGYDLRLSVDRVLPHFGFDSQTNEVFSRSDEMKNPAVQITLRRLSDASQGMSSWLFAFFPEMSDPHKKLPPLFDYTYTVPAQEAFADWVYLIGKTREIWKVRGHKVVEKVSFDGKGGEDDSPAIDVGFPLRITRILTHAVVKRDLRTLSNEFKNPVIGYTVLRNGQPIKDRFGMERVHSAGAQPEAHFFDKDRLVIEYANRIGEKKDYRSELVVLENGREKKRQFIEVNSPMYYDPSPWWAFWSPGFYFYQSNFNPDDLTYSGLRVTRDPGLRIVYFGFGGLVAGVIWIFYFPSWPSRRR